MGAQSKPYAAPSPWARAAAGASGAVLANGLVYPLDMVKTRLQVQYWLPPDGKPGPKPDAEADADPDLDSDLHYSSTWHALCRIVSDDGLGGLYAGIAGSLLGVASTNFAYFYWYTTARSLYLAAPSRSAYSPSIGVELALGAAAGALAQIFTIPVAVVTTRQQTAHRRERKSLLETAQDVVQGPDGIRGLWRGLGASLVLVVNPAITYGVYERLKSTLFRGRQHVNPLEAFVLGALSKALATVITQPLIIAKVCLQSKPPPSRLGRPFSTFAEVLSYIVQHEGVSGLFKGMAPQILKGFLVQGILMMTKERLELSVVLLLRYLRSRKLNGASVIRPCKKSRHGMAKALSTT